MRRPLGPALALLLASSASPALAAWPNSPFVNLPVSTASASQQDVVAVTDGAGGAILAWTDFRSGTGDVYAQRVLASGVVDPAWPANGRALCTAAGNQSVPALASDGAGGAIVTWTDLRGGATTDIYAQRVLASGLVDPAWPVNGRALCIAAGTQSFPSIVSDGAGGAVVAWIDNRGAAADIYAQRVLASGAVDPAWPADGRAVSVATNTQDYPQCVTDGAGGAIVVWRDFRGGAAADVYAHRILVSGVVDPAWPADGRALCTATGSQSWIRAVADGAGGAIAVWDDTRSGATWDIYAQRVLPTGSVDGAWPADGRLLCAASGDQLNPVLASDGAGGAIAAWSDYRAGAADVYAQHVTGNGLVDPAWPADGRGLCTAAGHQAPAAIVPDGSGGAVVGWWDFRTDASGDAYAHRVQASGAADAMWPVNGLAVSTASRSQQIQALVADGNGGILAAFMDQRTASSDVYAQRIARHGCLGTPEPEIASVSDVPGDQGGRVKVSWNASYLEHDPYGVVTYYRVYRSLPPNLAAALRRAGARVLDAAASDAFERPGDLLATVSAGTTYYWELLGTVSSDYLYTYSYHAPTAGDSTAAGAPATAFMVQARTSGTHHWESWPATGHSVDNLAPAAPAPLTGQFAAGATRLHWNPNAETDLAGYRLYRGTSAAFVPGPASLVAAVADTGYTDAGGAPFVYKLTAVDTHGNESPAATLTPSGTLDAAAGAPLALALAAPWPNPAGAATTLRLAMPAAGVARLAVYDAAGRLVRELAGGALEAGEHVASWDLRDGGGAAVRPGLYFARLEAGGNAVVRRVVVAR